jgi:hypothetical protein
MTAAPFPGTDVLRVNELILPGNDDRLLQRRGRGMLRAIVVVT